MNLDQVVRNIDRRLERVEQILPTLPTREELDQALDRKLDEKLDAKLNEKLKPLTARMDAFDQRLMEEAERSRTFTQIHYEDLKDDIRLLADGVVRVQATLDQMVRPKLDNHERRITALEDEHGQARGGPQG
jgi:exonuclease VII large subunit